MICIGRTSVDQLPTYPLDLSEPFLFLSITTLATMVKTTTYHRGQFLSSAVASEPLRHGPPELAHLAFSMLSIQGAILHIVDPFIYRQGPSTTTDLPTPKAPA